MSPANGAVSAAEGDLCGLDAAIGRRLEPPFADAGCAGWFRIPVRFACMLTWPLYSRKSIRIIFPLFETQGRGARSQADLRNQFQLLGDGLWWRWLRMQKAVRGCSRDGDDDAAVSGAGYSWRSIFWDILGNVVPYIATKKKRWKRRRRKLLGRLDGAVGGRMTIVPAPFRP